MQSPYTKYKNKYLIIKNQIAGEFTGFLGLKKKSKSSQTQQTPPCINNNFSNVKSIGFEFESKRNFIPFTLRKERGKYVLNGTGGLDDAIIIKNTREKLVLSKDTTVLKCPGNNTIFSVFNYEQCNNKKRVRTPFSIDIGNITINNSNDICHPEFIHTYYSVDSSPNVIIEKHAESMLKIISYLKSLTRITLYEGRELISTQASTNSLIFKLLKIHFDKFDVTQDMISNSNINKVELLIDETHSRAFIVYSYGQYIKGNENRSKFNLDVLLNGDMLTIEKLEEFNKIFFSQLTVGCLMENLYKIIGSIEKNCQTGCDRISEKIIDILCNFKKNLPTKNMPLNITDQDISILYLCLHYLFYYLNSNSTDYKFDVKYSIRHFNHIILKHFKYNETVTFTDNLKWVGLSKLSIVLSIFLDYVKNKHTKDKINVLNEINSTLVNISKLKILMGKNAEQFKLPTENKELGSFIYDTLRLNIDDYTSLEALLNNLGNDRNDRNVTAWGTQIYPFSPNFLMEVRDKSEMLKRNTITYLERIQQQQEVIQNPVVGEKRIRIIDDDDN